MNNHLYLFDQKLREKYPHILGIDEVGRGCVAGPLVVCGLILNPEFYYPLIKDSKQIKSIALRKELKEIILANALHCETIVVSASEVDVLNPKQASRNGMQTIAFKLINHFDLCLTDYEKISGLKKPQINLVKGDNISFSISCASIVAKSIRDKLMQDLDSLYPEFEFNKNQGYLTKQHQIVLQKLKPIQGVHRFSYKPIAKLIK